MNSELRGFSTAQVRKIAGVTERQIENWIQDEFLTPSVAQGKRGMIGGRACRRWSYSDLLAMRVCGDLAKTGISLKTLQAIRDHLLSRGGDFSATHIIVRGDDIFIERSGDITAFLLGTEEAPMAVIYNLEQSERQIRKAIEKVA